VPVHQAVESSSFQIFHAVTRPWNELTR